MPMFKNFSQQWRSIGTVGPFAMSQGVSEGQVTLVKCHGGDVLNMKGTSMVRFEPPEVRYTVENFTETQHKIEIFLHASFPPEIQLPNTQCVVVNHNITTAPPLPSPKKAATAFEDPEWLLISHFVPPLPSERKQGELYAWKCQPAVAGTRVVPPVIVLDESNYTNPSYLMALHVHTSFPDDQPIVQPNCQLSVLTKHTVAVEFYPFLNWLAVLVMVASTVYLFYHKPNEKATTRPKGQPKKTTTTKHVSKRSKKHGQAKKTKSRSPNPKENGKKSTPKSNTTNHISLSDYLVMDDNNEDDELPVCVEKEELSSRQQDSAPPKQESATPDKEETPTWAGDWTIVGEVKEPSKAVKANATTSTSPKEPHVQVIKRNGKSAQDKAHHLRIDPSPAKDHHSTGCEESKDDMSCRRTPKELSSRDLAIEDQETMAVSTETTNPRTINNQMEDNGIEQQKDEIEQLQLRGGVKDTKSDPPTEKNHDKEEEEEEGLASSSPGKDNKMDPPGTMQEEKNGNVVQNKGETVDDPESFHMEKHALNDDEKNATIPNREVNQLLAERAPSESPAQHESYEFVLYVGGMTCHGCETVVHNTLASIKDVSSVVVSWKDASAIIRSSAARLDLLAVAQAMDAVGFGVFLGPSMQAEPKRNAANGNDDNMTLTPPPGFQQGESTLSLMDELRIGSVPIRRYRCRCGAAECICSAQPVHSNDPGQEVSLSDLCARIESNLGRGGGSLFGAISKPERSTLKDWIQSSGGGSGEFREQLASMPIPCSCGKSQDHEKGMF